MCKTLPEKWCQTLTFYRAGFFIVFPTPFLFTLFMRPLEGSLNALTCFNSPYIRGDA
jgi:hypothetical protein